MMRIIDYNILLHSVWESEVEENIIDSDPIEDKDENGSEHETIEAVNLLSHKTKDGIVKTLKERRVSRRDEFSDTMSPIMTGEGVVMLQNQST